jgi:hypothetical protein
MSDLYDTDTVTWSEQQAELLRRVSVRERTNDLVASVRQKIDHAGLYADALRGLPDKMDDQAPLPVPHVCPMTQDELLAME